MGAYSIEARCLRNHLNECNGNASCIAQVNAAISTAEYRWRIYREKAEKAGLLLEGPEVNWWT